MVTAVSPEKTLFIECPRCGSTLSYLWTEVRIQSVNCRGRYGARLYFAFYYIDCPVCNQRVEIRKGKNI